jgi:hypothetical protein
MAISEAAHLRAIPRAQAERPPARRAPWQTNGRHDAATRLTRTLGWLSLGLGLAEIVVPRRLARLVGIDDTTTRRRLVRALGLRELASGVGILARQRPARWIWSRIAGDAMDLGLLGRAMVLPDAHPRRVATATAAVAGVTLLDLLAGDRRARSGRAEAGVRTCVTIHRQPDEVYAFWRRLDGTTIGWNAEIVADEPGRRIAWRPSRGPRCRTAGTSSSAPRPADAAPRSTSRWRTIRRAARPARRSRRSPAKKRRGRSPRISAV